MYSNPEDISVVGDVNDVSDVSDGNGHPSGNLPVVCECLKLRACLFVVLYFLFIVATSSFYSVQVMSPDEALMAIRGAQDWEAMEEVVMALHVDLHILQSASLKSLHDIPQHFVDKRYHYMYGNFKIPTLSNIIYSLLQAAANFEECNSS